MEKSMNDRLAVYQKALAQGDVPAAYEGLMRFMHGLKSHFEGVWPDTCHFGNISPGYMDYTYFPFFSAALRAKKLRFGIVLNHRQLRFELWLMGQNAQVQASYWSLLRNTPWNQGRGSRGEGDHALHYIEGKTDMLTNEPRQTNK